MKKTESILFWGKLFAENYKLLSVIFFISLLISIYFATPFFIMRGTGLTVVAVLIAIFALSVKWEALKCVSENPAVLSNAGGIYSSVRFPFYFSDMLIMCALSLFSGVWSYFVFICPIAYIVFDRTIVYREYVMQDKYANAFVEWTRHTRALFVLPHAVFKRSKKEVNRRLLFAGIAPRLLFLTFAFICIDLVKTWRIDFRPEFNYITAVCLGVSLIVSLLSFMIKRD